MTIYSSKAPFGIGFLTFLLFLLSVGTLIDIDVVAAQETDTPPRKNVLFIVTDDCNCDLGCLGHPLVKTPNIDALAERGTLFSKAYCQYPVCNPSRSSFMTGLYPDQTGVLSNQGDFRKANPNVVTMSQMFRNQGYFAARVGKIYHYGVPLQIGTDGEDDRASWDLVVNPRGIDREVHDQIHTLQEGQFGGTLSWLNLLSEPSQHTDGIAAAEAISMLEQRQLLSGLDDRPFFMAVGFYRPHTPYVAPPEFFENYPLESIEPVMEVPGDRDDIPKAALMDRPKQRELTVEKRKEIIQAYYASVSLMDQQVGKLVGALDRLGLTKNTTIVFISDHGYHLGQHGLWQKSDLFEGSCRVPVIIVDPSMKPAQTSQSLVGLIDLYPTLAELTGVVPPEHIKGKSLVPVLKDPAATVQDGVLSVTVSRMRQKLKKGEKKKRIMGYSVRTKSYRYTQWGRSNRGNEPEYGHELYNYDSDPNELTNLVDDPAHAAALSQMQSQLKQLKEKAQ